MATTCSPIILVPGKPGDPGTPGSNGTNGQSSHTTVDGQFLMPAEGADVVVGVINSDWMVVGQNYGVESAGTMLLVSIGSSTQITLRNIENTALGLYPGNVAPGTAIPDGSDIGIGGIQGNAGAVAGGALLAVNNLLDVPNPIAARTNLGLGSSATRNTGIAANQQPFVDPTTAPLVAGQSVWATAAGLKSLPQVTALANLGVILGVAITNVPAATANLVNGEALFATATGLRSQPPAAARALLGITSGIIARISFENQAVADAGGFTSGAWRTVPLNITDVNTSGTALLAANQMTLAAGTYSFRAFMTGYLVDRFQCRLFNVTSGNPLKYGTTEESNGVGDDPTSSHVEGRFTIAAGQLLELQAQCLTTRAVDGFGEAPVFGSAYSLLAGVYFDQEA